MDQDFNDYHLKDYLKPHWKQFLVVILLILVVTGFNLLRPKILQVAIDDHIDVLDQSYRESADGEIELNGSRFTRMEEGEKGEYYLVQTEKGFYWTTDQNNPESGVLLNEDQVMNLRQGDFRGVITLALIYLLTVVSGFALSYGQVYLLNRTGQSIIYKLRKDLYARLLNQSMKFFDTRPLGNLVTRVTNDTENLNELFVSVLSGLIRNLIMVAGILVIMFSMDMRLAFFVLLITPVIVLISVLFRKQVRKVYQWERSVLSKINNHLSEDLSGMRMIQILNREKGIYKEFDIENRDYRNATRREVLLFSMFRPGIELIRALAISLLIYFGGRGYLAQTISFGVLYAFVDYIQQFFMPILNLAETYNVYQSASTSSDRIFSLLNEDNEMAGLFGKRKIENFRGKIEFKNVWFAYVKEEWVLKDVSFVIEPCELVAFVGATGAGKSSIINLIGRYYEIQKGQILFDDVDIMEYDPEEIRKFIGFVQQDVFLFTGTIYDNITLGNPEISRETVEQAIKDVNLTGFIERLPQGLETPVMERGATFSAGERQLLSFARTLVRDPGILILDEATANIDTETELMIQEALNKMSKSRTTIAIAHRISTIADADNIIVLSHGEIAEEGNREELIEKDGIFKVLYELQYEQ
ncbi:MAG: ABC transporter ATP-binding protein [Gallicola sp.]|nr:ABC transporter ATP-binding protein [Gallicola sp.]